ncbi:MAG: hypothetical protein SPI30_10305 [Prevotella sp.]|nr:hypothetical protein [Prevotella sp.]
MEFTYMNRYRKCTFYPNSVIRDRTDYVRMSGRLSVAFAKGVAGYAEEERQRRCRQSTEISR